MQLEFWGLIPKSDNNVMQRQAWLPVGKILYYFSFCTSRKKWTPAMQAYHGATKVSFIRGSGFELFLLQILHTFLIINSIAAARTDLTYNVSVHYSHQRLTPFLSPLAFFVSSHIWCTQPGWVKMKWWTGFPHESDRNEEWDRSHDII